MLRNYIQIALRTLWKNKVFSLINIVGLAVGMACCLLILLYVQHELSYDTHNDRSKDLYRLVTEFVTEAKTEKAPTCAAPVAAAVKNEFPEVEEVTRVFIPFSEDKAIFKRMAQGKALQSFYESKGIFADPTFFDLFAYEFLEGSPKHALERPNSVVISKEIAQKLYGNNSALNQVIRISSSNGDLDFKITGVFRSVGPSHIDSRYIMSLSSGNIGEFVRSTQDFASNNMFFTYLKLRPGSEAKSLEAKFPAFIDKYMGKDLKRVAFKKNQYLESVPSIHLYTDAETIFNKKGNIQFVYILITVALFTLVIACINFMNLSTARSGKRAAEVGIRKVMGAEKETLIGQFLAESMIISLLALVIAIFLVEVSLPLFNAIAETDLSISFTKDYTKLLLFLGLALVTGVLAGSYPAFYLSSFNPAQVLKSKASNSLAAINLRKALVVFQFALSIILILGSLVIWRQMDFLQHQDLGFVKDQQLVIPLRTNLAKEHYATFKQAIEKNSEVVSAAAATSYPGIFVAGDQTFYREGKTVENGVTLRMNHVNYDFMETMGFQKISGRFFSPQFPADTAQRIIVNEHAVAKLGYTPQTVLGKTLHWNGSEGRLDYQVVGVVKDFNFAGLQKPIDNFGFILAPWGLNYMIVRTNTAQVSRLLSSLENTWKTFNPEEPFEYSFLDQDFQRNYETEQKMGTLISYFTTVAILIACLGLYGLAAFTAEQKIKEIGVRKVLGASITSIVSLLSRDFMKLVLIAYLIAVPASWFLMDKWLEEFAYRTELSWWLFAGAGFIAFLIALATVSSQTIRAAMVNPVKSLKSE